MKIMIRVLRNDGDDWAGLPRYAIEVPDGLTAKDIDYLPNFLGIKAKKFMDNTMNEKERRFAQAAREARESNALHDVRVRLEGMYRGSEGLSLLDLKVGLGAMLGRLEEFDAD